MKNYVCTCPNCGFGFSVATDNTDDLEEITSCPCGAQCDFEIFDI